MPDNVDHDTSPIFDWHEHHDTGHHYAVTHDHDVHPRHHHDRNGSVIYVDPTFNIERHRPAGDDDHHIGVGGNDLDRRTTPPATPA